MAGPALDDSVPVHKRPAPHVGHHQDQKRAKVDATVEAEDPEQPHILRPPHSPEVFADLGVRLRRGDLVSFPTETVYGLGANGLDASAVLRIFEAKGRPLSDPCILHVASSSEATKLMQLNELEQDVFNILAGACWPGPLSIVGRAQSHVPPEVTASTGFVAIRCPDHSMARQLITAAGKPLAAPSANRFGHISPTLPEHVLEDLKHVRGLRILDGGPCGVGIESTVAKLDLEHHRVVVLRKGCVTRERLQSVLAHALATGLLRSEVSVEYAKSLSASVESLREKEAAAPNQALESPGLLLRHYSPSVPSALLATELVDNAIGEKLHYRVDRSILIDFGRQMQSAYGHFLKTFDLCCQHDSLQVAGSVEEACARIFAVLRMAEAFAVSHDACFICIADFSASRLGGFAEALHDRMFRAASGRRVALCSAGSPYFTHLSG